MNGKHLLFFVLLTASTAPAYTLNGKVVGVLDGECVVILDDKKEKHTVRMAGIDAPVRGQPFHLTAKKSLRELAMDKSATVDWDKYDDYCETAKISQKKCWKVGRVIIDSNDLNLEQVKRGLAWHGTFRMSEQTTGDRTSYGEAQREAQKKHLGLWIDPHPVPPWEFKRSVASTPAKKKKAAQ